MWQILPVGKSPGMFIWMDSQDKTLLLTKLNSRQWKYLSRVSGERSVGSLNRKWKEPRAEDTEMNEKFTCPD